MNNVPWGSRGGMNLFSSKMKAGEVLKGRSAQLPYFTDEKTQGQRGHVTCTRSWYICGRNKSVTFSVTSNSFMTQWTVAHQGPLSMGFPR